MKEKNWIVTPTVFEKQLKAMSHFYGDHGSLVKSYINKNNKRPDLIGSAILGWQLLHIAIKYYQEKYPNWCYIRHEDLSIDPIDQFVGLFNRLDIEYNLKAKSKIEATSQGVLTQGRYRDSHLNVKKWKQRLQVNEIDRIKNETYPLWKEFYMEEDW
jgi:hypothetical protein